MLKEGYLKENYRYFHLKDTAGQERDFHFHDFDKIVILLSGNVEYAVENELYSLRPYDVLLVKHHTIHKALIDKSVPYERVIIYLDESRYARLIPEAALTNCFDRKLFTPDRAQLETLLQSLENCTNEILKETYLIQLLAILNGLEGNQPTRERYNAKIETVLSYINENLSRPLSVDELAETVFMSRYHFMRTFKEATGQTVHAYVRQRRLLNASRLIREGVSVQQSARLSGFEDYSVFYKAFTQSFGIKPGELKK